MGWYDALKDAITVAQKADNIELTRQLLDAQRELLDMQAENNRLRGEIFELRSKEADAEGLHFDKNSYWKTMPAGAADGPFCSRCWDFDKKLVRLKTSTKYVPVCPNCKNYFEEI